MNETGEYCRSLLDNVMKNVDVDEIQMDEMWSYAIVKQRRIKDHHPVDAGDWFIFSGICPISKAVISHRVGRRNEVTTDDFVEDLANRIVGRFQLSSDAWGSYKPAVLSHLGGRVDYGTLHKTYKTDPNPADPARYTPAKCVAVQWQQVAGAPDPSMSRE